MHRSGFGLFTVAAVIAVAAGVAPIAMAADDPAPNRLRVLTWNICGEAGGGRGDAGYCPYRNEPDAKVDVIANLVADNDINVIMLQEVCGESDDSHLGRLQTKLGDDWQIGHARGARPDGRTDCRGDLTGELGVALAVKAPDAEFDSADTVPPGGNAQTLPILCATTTQWTTRMCTTHILSDPNDPRRAGQIDNVVDYIADDHDDVILGGDFNMFPDSDGLKPIGDQYDECDALTHGDGDEADEVTHHAWANHSDHVFRKRDHLFASPGDGRFTACDSHTELMDDTENEADSGPPSGYSDHAPLVGTVDIGYKS